MRVLLTGSTGFVGKAILLRLLSEGHEVVCLIRPKSANMLKSTEHEQKQIKYIKGDLFDHALLEKAASGCDAVVHLVGIIRENPRNGVTFQRLHVTGTQNLLQAAMKAGVAHFVHMSALGAREQATSQYHQTKYAAEQAVIESGLPYTIFRPSVIFGPGDEFVNMLADIVRLPITPVIGDGLYQLQPVSRRTVADVFTQALTNPLARNRIFETGGPDKLTYLRILDDIGAALHKRRVRKLHIPLTLMKPVVSAMEGFSFFPITKTQLIMLQEGNICADSDSLYQVFPTKKIPFAEGIKEYL